MAVVVEAPIQWIVPVVVSAEVVADDAMMSLIPAGAEAVAVKRLWPWCVRF